MSQTFTSVIPCDTCEDGTLKATPGRGLVCSNGCDPLTPERASRPDRPATPHQRMRERWDTPERPAGNSARPALTKPEQATRPVPASTWEVFDVRWTKRGGSGVRLGKNGQLAIGSALSAMFSTAQRVELRYDRTGQRIGLIPTDLEHGAKLMRSDKTSQIRVSLAGLLNHYGLPCPAKNLAIAATMEAGVLVVPVKDLAS